MVLWIGPSLLDGSSQNRVWVPLTLTSATSRTWCLGNAGVGTQMCLSQEQKSRLHRGVRGHSWGGHVFVVPGSPPLEEVQPRFEYGPQL